MASLSAFATRMSKRAKLVEKRALEIKKLVATTVAASVIDNTPVDTGEARSNWQTSVGSPAAIPRGPYAPGSKGSTGAANSAAAKAQNVAAVAAAGPGDSIHIVNTAKHIAKLNAGSSLQAPAGFVEKAVLDGIMAIKGSKLTV
jgi:hypothetical protein